MIKEAEEEKEKINDKLGKIKVDLDKKKITKAEYEKKKIEHRQQLIGINSRITILKKNTSFSPVINRIPAVIDM